MTRRQAAALAFFLFPLLAVVNCGAALDQEKEGEGKGGAISVELVWPEGFKHERSSKRLHFPSGAVAKSAPAYVTGIKLAITGEKMEPMLLDVPTDTLKVTVTLGFGVRRFDLAVNTNIGVTFTGSITVNIAPGVGAVLRFPLEINAPPVIEKIEVSPPAPKKGDTVTVAAVARDMDPDDVLTYKWAGTGPRGEAKNFEGKSFTDIVEHGGIYKADLAVDDGHGGVARKSVSFEVINIPPAITSISAVYDPNLQVINLSCSAEDPDDPPAELVYTWFGPFGWKAFGATAVYQGSCGEFTCEVRDDDGGLGKKRAMVEGAPPTITSFTQSALYAKPGDTINMSCSATDPDNDIFEYLINTGANTYTGPNASHVFTGSGDVQANCKVVDECGLMASSSICFNSCQYPRPAAACSADFASGVIKVSITVPAGTDIDLEVTAPGGVKTWYGNLRPGNSSELCVDLACPNAGGGVELVYWSAGSTPPVGVGNMYTVKVRYANDCGAGSAINYNINFNSNGDCSTSGYCFNSVSGPGVACAGVNTCNAVANPINIGVTDTFTLDVTSP